MLSHTVPHCVNIQISILPSYCVEPPTNLICPLKLHCPPEIIVQVAHAYKFENSYIVHSIRIHCPVLTCNMHHCLTRQPHKQKMAQEIPLHFTDSTMYNKKENKNAAVEFVLRKLLDRGWSRRCTQTLVHFHLIAFQWLPYERNSGSDGLLELVSCPALRGRGLGTRLLWNEANPKLETWERGQWFSPTHFRDGWCTVFH